jgi:uncharacterized protein YuzB (UPF0349 family)
VVQIDFCRSNVDAFTSELFEELRALEPQIRVNRYGCLANCGECSQKPYAFVDDDLITADTVPELREKVLSLIAKKTPGIIHSR